MKTKETILKEPYIQKGVFKECTTRWQISTVIRHYQTYVNRFINIDKDDLDHLYESINDIN